MYSACMNILWLVGSFYLSYVLRYIYASLVQLGSGAEGLDLGPLHDSPRWVRRRRFKKKTMRWLVVVTTCIYLSWLSSLGGHDVAAINQHILVVGQNVVDDNEPINPKFSWSIAYPSVCQLYNNDIPVLGERIGEFAWRSGASSTHTGRASTWGQVVVHNISSNMYDPSLTAIQMNDEGPLAVHTSLLKTFPDLIGLSGIRRAGGVHCGSGAAAQTHNACRTGSTRRAPDWLVGLEEPLVTHGSFGVPGNYSTHAPMCFSPSLMSLCWLFTWKNREQILANRSCLRYVVEWTTYHVKLTSVVAIFICICILSAMMAPAEDFIGMQGGGRGGGHHGGHYRHHHHRGHHHHGHRQGGDHRSSHHGNQYIPRGYGSSTTKVPPAWSPEFEASYSFNEWYKDVIHWSMACELTVQQQASAVVQQLGGPARDLAREMDPMMLRDGGVIDTGDGQGPRQVTGLPFLIHHLKKRYAPLEEEVNMRAISQLMNFQKKPNEPIDLALSRWETVRHRAENNGGIDMPISGLSWQLLVALRFSAHDWQRILQPFQGQLPQTDDEYLMMISMLRRTGHLSEAHPMNIRSSIGHAHYMVNPEEQGAPPAMTYRN